MNTNSLEIIFYEDWDNFDTGYLYRDNSARGEYMCRTVPDNPNGWYQPASTGWTAENTGPEKSCWKIEKKNGNNTISQTTHSGTDLMCLTKGYKEWSDYSIRACFDPLGKELTGLILRYKTSRDFYAAAIELDTVKLLKRAEGVWTVLDAAPFTSEHEVMMKFLAQDDKLQVAIGGKKVLSAQDGTLAGGGIGLLANSPADFGPVTVEKTETIEKISIPRSVTQHNDFPDAELACDIDISGLSAGRQIRFADLNGDGVSEILLALPKEIAGEKWTYYGLSQLTAIDTAGTILWQNGETPDSLLPVTQDLPFQAAERGNGLEIAACFSDELQILAPETGETIDNAQTPEPPAMEDFWDEIQMYFGSGHGDDLPRVIPDAIRLCNLTGTAPYHDILIKDRYHNAWGIDGTSLKVLWHHQCNIGHFPYAWDPDNSGYDTIILGYSRLDHQGTLTGRLFLGDHPDGCFAYTGETGITHMLHPSGEAGLIDERSDGPVEEIHLGHVQHLSVANFCPSLPGLERLIVTFHGGEGIIILLDSRNRIIRKTEKFKSGAVCQPVNWTGDGTELIAFSPRIGDGGLWNAQFETVVPLPETDRPEMCMEVHDVLGLGVDQLIIWDNDRLQIYKPSDIPDTPSYAPKRPWPNMSNYQVNFSV